MVEVWSWIIGYAVLFAVVQLAIYAYYVRRGDGRPSASAIGDPDDYPRTGDRVQHDPVDDPQLDDTDPQTTQHDADDTHRTCPHCGTTNDATATIKYCRICTRSLG
ncbi:hypothetical protein G9C85_11035 [Halorubellus sp. JP-L1]|uniref:DUF7577 domain-containing protein n=1 Tax=Halorubellus sp. JP-L1 TaxID=2715753 RepID=UPI001409A0F2|nr:hypothetical protein [Halorubellus sp. JP-L1]NHN42157.1 hypothetical protein [Halorubellus sp. JP-L1]